MIPDSHEAEVIRFIFDPAKRDEKVSNIAIALNGKRYTRRNGKPWTPRQVAAILSRTRLYREGVLQYGEATGLNESLVLIRDKAQP